MTYEVSSEQISFNSVFYSRCIHVDSTVISGGYVARCVIILVPHPRRIAEHAQLADIESIFNVDFTLKPRRIYRTWLLPCGATSGREREGRGWGGEGKGGGAARDRHCHHTYSFVMGEKYVKAINFLFGLHLRFHRVPIVIPRP